MKVILLFLFILILYYCMKKKPTNNRIEEGFSQCDYRKKQNTGTMCKEKWGQPNCHQWGKIEKIKELEKKESTELQPLKGFYSNPFMYSIDYEKEEGEDEGPRGVHSSFFSQI